jgi:hypothetical protein
LVSGEMPEGRKRNPVKTIAATLITFAAAGMLLAQSPDAAANPNVRHVIGLESIQRNATGMLTVQDGALLFKTSKAEEKVAVASIDDIFVGTETTQAGGKKGRAVKTAAMAAPYGSGRTLSLMMRTKVDILTVSFRNPDGGRRGVIFALPIGQATAMRTQLVQAGAHASPLENQVVEASKP